MIISTWAAHNGCADEPSREPVTAGVYRLRYSGCNDGADIELYVVDGGGHTWPDATSDEERLGFTTHEISANDLMWEFFEQHPLVTAPESTATPPAAQLPDTGGADESGGLDTMWFAAIGVAAIVVAAGASALFGWRRGS